VSGVNRGVARDVSLRSCHPIGIQPIPVLAGSKSIIPDLIVAYARSARVQPPKARFLHEMRAARVAGLQQHVMLVSNDLRRVCEQSCDVSVSGSVGMRPLRRA
jgi:hypothetical protein